MKMKTQKIIWDTLKAVLQGKLLALRTYTKNSERAQINTLMRQLKNLEKQEPNSNLFKY